MRGIGILLAGLLLLAIAPPAAAGQTWSIVGELEIGITPVYDAANSCRYQWRCQEWAGIALVDVDIDAAWQASDASKPLRFNLLDTGDYLGSQAATWKVCQYNQYGQLLGCIETGDFGLGGGVDASATSMRVILHTGVDRPFDLVFWQSS